MGTREIPEAWRELGRKVTDRRVELGYRTLRAFADYAGLSTKTLGEIEGGKRASYDRATLVQVEQALRWPSGTIAQLTDRASGSMSAFVTNAPSAMPSRWEISELPSELVELLWFWQASNLDGEPGDRAAFLRQVEDLRKLWMRATSEPLPPIDEVSQPAPPAHLLHPDRDEAESRR